MSRLRRRAALGVFALLLLAFLPPVRRMVERGTEAIAHAVASSRAREARAREVRAFAARYGIPAELADAIERAARAEGLPTDLAFRLVRVESAFRERAESPVGALGLTQLMPRTAAEMQPGITREQILERDTNLRLGFRYLKVLLARYDGDREEALHAYNRGMGTVARIREAGGDPANGYADRVLGPDGASPVRRGANGFARTQAPPLGLPPAARPGR